MRLIATIGLVCMWGYLLGQTNLVPNPSFEDYSMCPDGPGQINRINSWFSANTGTPDFFHECYSGPPPPFAYTNVPDNAAGYQYARTGLSYVGILTYCKPIGCFTGEYIEVGLSEPLSAGQTYYAEFYVSLADSTHIASDGLGLYFSDTLVNWTGPGLRLPFYPQINGYYDFVVTDKVNWTRISGTYTADGGEEYIVIGCFKDEAALNQTSDSLNSGSNDDAYYYIDDVSVILASDTVISGSGTFELWGNPASEEAVFVYNLANESKLTLYDVAGRLVHEETLQAGNRQLRLDITALRAGVYVYVVRDGSGVMHDGKLLVYD